MKRTGKALPAVALTVAGLTTVITGTASATGCTWTQGALPLPDGDTSGYVMGAANGGWFVGGGSTSNLVRWHGDQVENVNLTFGEQAALVDVNAAGVAVGYTYEGGFPDEAFVVRRDGRVDRLPTPPGYRASRSKAINDAGDVVGMASGIGDTYDLVLWPAAAPGTAVVITPDPTAYGYVTPVDIDEQGRILMQAEGSEDTYFLRHPDGTMTNLALNSADVTAFRNGRVSGELYENAKHTSVEWDLDGRVVHTLDRRASQTLVDSGTLTVGIYRTPDKGYPDKGYAVGVWDGGILTDTLVTTPRRPSQPLITDDGVVVVHDDDAGTITTFTRTCS